MAPENTVLISCSWLPLNTGSPVHVLHMPKTHRCPQKGVLQVGEESASAPLDLEEQWVKPASFNTNIVLFLS